MKMTALVLEEGEVESEYNGATRTRYELSLRDAGEGNRCKNNFAMTLTPDQRDKYGGKLRDQRVEVEIHNIAEPYQGLFRITGTFEPVDKRIGNETKPPAKL